MVKEIRKLTKCLSCGEKTLYLGDDYQVCTGEDCRHFKESEVTSRHRASIQTLQDTPTQTPPRRNPGRRGYRSRITR